MTRKAKTLMAEGATGNLAAQKQPKRLSKIGIWLGSPSEGIITVVDRRAVNR